MAIELLSTPTITANDTKDDTKAATKKSSKKSKKATAKVLICQKSNCWKKGGKASYENLKNELDKRNLSQEVDIKLTGCLKKCKKAPNLIVLPDKKHYVKVKPKQVPTIVEQHLS